MLQYLYGIPRVRRFGEPRLYPRKAGLMRPPQIRAFLDNELVVDSFAGGGGASTIVEQAQQRRTA